MTKIARLQDAASATVTETEPSQTKDGPPPSHLAPDRAQRGPSCRRRLQKDTKGTRPGGALERRTNLPYDERSLKKARLS